MGSALQSCDGINTNFVKQRLFEISTGKLYIVIYWRQNWLKMLTTWRWRLEKLISVFEVNDFECSPRPPVRQTREMWRIMRDTKPLFPSRPTDPLMDTGMVPAKEPREPNTITMLFHNSLLSFFTNFSFTGVLAQIEANVTHERSATRKCGQ